MLFPLVAKGFILGWSVAWPPGPINAQMLKRALAGRFWPAFVIGLGASCGDFCWALAVIAGAGALFNVPGVRRSLGWISLGLLLLLAVEFFRAAWRSWHQHRKKAPSPMPADRSGFLYGFGLAITGPWNLAFWLAVIGQQATAVSTWPALALAAAVVAGAMTWCTVLCFSARAGARWMTPLWDTATSGATGLVMLYFAAQSFLRM